MWVSPVGHKPDPSLVPSSSSNSSSIIISNSSSISVMNIIMIRIFHYYE